MFWTDVRDWNVAIMFPDSCRIVLQLHETGMSYALLPSTPPELRWNLDSLAQQQLDYEAGVDRLRDTGVLQESRDAEGTERLRRRWSGWRRDPQQMGSRR